MLVYAKLIFKIVLKIIFVFAKDVVRPIIEKVIQFWMYDSEK